MERMPVSSSSIRSVGHEGDVLEVEFQGGKVYRYRGVAREHYDALVGADSVGRHFGDHVRGKFDHELVDPNGIETESARARG